MVYLGGVLLIDETSPTNFTPHGRDCPPRCPTLHGIIMLKPDVNKCDRWVIEIQGVCGIMAKPPPLPSLSVATHNTSFQGGPVGGPALSLLDLYVNRDHPVR